MQLLLVIGRDRVFRGDRGCFVFQQCVRNSGGACIECLCCSQVGYMFLRALFAE